mgnify:CR=1 FL=1
MASRCFRRSSSASLFGSVTPTVEQRGGGECAERAESVGLINDGALAKDGIAVVRVDTAAVEEVRAMYMELVSEEGGGGEGGFRRASPTVAPVSRSSALQNRRWTEEVPVLTEASGFRISDREGFPYDVYTTGWTPTMRWVAAGGAETLSRFEATLGAQVGAALAEALEEDVTLLSACFVVVRGGVFDGEAKLHADWASAGIPRGRVHTALCPLWEFPDSVGGLFWKPSSSPVRREGPFREGSGRSCDARRGDPVEESWVGQAACGEALHRYRLGEAVVFDGKLLHRTQPFADANFTRVLASLSFCATSEAARPHWPDILQVSAAPQPLPKSMTREMRCRA